MSKNEINYLYDSDNIICQKKWDRSSSICSCRLIKPFPPLITWVKKQDTKLLPITSPSVNRFSKILSLSLPVKEFWKTVNIWRSYGQECSVLFFSTHGVVSTIRHEGELTFITGRTDRGLLFSSSLFKRSKDIPADIAPSALETIIFYCFMGYIQQ